MTEPEKVRIKPLETGDDYRLWKIRVEAACDAKGLDDVLNRERNPHSDTDEKAKFEADKRKASGIIVAALSNEQLRVVRTEIGKPYNMLKKLNERYDSKSAASRIAKMTELVSLRYEHLKKDIGDHIDKMAGIVEQLSGMSTEIPEELAIALLIASIRVEEMAPITAAVKTLPDDSATWDTVTARLIEEHQSLRARRNSERATVILKRCEICGKSHYTKHCWLNPNNPKNRLQLKNNNPLYKNDSKDTNQKSSTTGTKKETHKTSRTRAAVARSFAAKKRECKTMMLDSGTTSHMTPCSEQVHSLESCSVSIALGDDSTLKAHSKGTMPVIWNGSDGKTEVSLSETLIAEDLALSLLSVPSLTSKGMAVLFLPEKALIVDIEDSMRIIGIASKGEDGLYCINIDGSNTIQNTESGLDKAMMAVTRQQIEQQPGQQYSTEQESDSSGNSDMDSDEESQSTEHNTETDGNDSDDDDKSSNDEKDSFDWDIQEESTGNTAPLSNTDADDVSIWHSRLGHQGSKTDIRDMMKCGILPAVKSTSETCDPCIKGKYRRLFRGSLTKENAPGRIHADLVGRVKPTSVSGFIYTLTIIDEATRYLQVYPLRRKNESSAKLIQFMNMFERQTGHKLKGLHTDGGSEFYKARTKFEKLGIRVTTSTVYTPSSNGLVERAQGTIMSLARTCLLEAKVPLQYWEYAIPHVVKGRNLMKHTVTKKSPYMALFGTYPEYAKHLRPFGCRALAAPTMKRTGKFEPRLLEGINLGHVDGGIYKILCGDKIVVTKHVRLFDISRILYTEFPGHTLVETQHDENGQLNREANDGYQSESSDEEINLEPTDTSTQEPNTLDLLTHIPEKPSSFGESSNTSTYDTVAKATISYDGRSLPQTITTSDEPTVREALSSTEASEWKNAISEEFKTLEQAKTWTACNDTTVRPLPSGMILRLKRDKNGNPLRFKARLVARGNLQKDDCIREELYAPVACFDIVRVLLAVSISKGWSRHHVDVKGAFLYAELPDGDDVWLKLPNIDGIPEADGSVVKRRKSLYGLRKAAKLWYKHFADRIAILGFEKLISSECLFRLVKKGNIVILLVYVDDIALLGDDKLCSRVIQELKQHYEITEMDGSNFFLGVNIEDIDEGLFLSQPSQISKIVEKCGMENCKPMKIPLPVSHCLYESRQPLNEIETQDMEQVPFKEILGSMLFLSTRTRPDIATAVSMLGKFASQPGPEHWKMMKHLVRYLKVTANHSLLYKSNHEADLLAWSNADWGRDLDKDVQDLDICLQLVRIL